MPIRDEPRDGPPFIHLSERSLPTNRYLAGSGEGDQCFLKYCTSRSCCFACSRFEKVPKLRRFPVEGSFLREYKRNCPDFNFRIIPVVDAQVSLWVA
jgi:hypothetical protein